MKTYRILKLQTLIDKKACPQQVKLFRSMFGDSVRVTEKRCVSVADKFDFTWAAIYLLSASAYADYIRAVAAAFADYNRAVAADYSRAAPPAWDDYMAAALADYSRYKRAVALARADYSRAVAAAFARAYLSRAAQRRLP